MLKDIAWKMFKETGNIEYFLRYKEIDEKNTDFLTEVASEIVLDGEKCHMSKQEE
ncbi:MAG: YqzL family protein [Clostridiaceae bacterium]|jgi:hypothetical protein|nr:YqzL family protein [Clostridiaceae bacterium]